MDRTWWDRWMPASGIVFVVLFVVGFLVIGDPPRVGEPAGEFAAFFVEERGRILAGAILVGLSLYAWVWFAAAAAARVRAAGEPRLAAAVLGGGAVFAAMTLAFIGMAAAIAHTPAEEADPEVVKGLAMLSRGVRIMGFFPAAALVLAFGVAALRSGLVATWFGGASLLAAFVVLLAGTTWAREGFWEPYGTYTSIAMIVLLLWTVVASVLLISRPGSGGRA